MNESKHRLPAIQARAGRALAALRGRYPHPDTLLAAASPWELLVATILAAQCTDARVNMVTPGFFARWPDPAALAEASVADVENCIRSTGFFRNKAKNLVATAVRIRDVFQGQVPRSLAELVSLPGVARKTASVVLFGAYGLAEGLAVDTHVGRIAFRLGLASTRDPLRTEQELMALFPREEWGNLNHRLVWFGREVCRARNPACSACEMESFCAKTGLLP
jgi:endonuclease-3